MRVEGYGNILSFARVIFGGESDVTGMAIVSLTMK